MPTDTPSTKKNGANGNGNGHANGDDSAAIETTFSRGRSKRSAPPSRDDRARIARRIETACEMGPVAIVSLSQVSHHGEARVASFPAMGQSPMQLATSVYDQALDDARMQRGLARYVVGIHSEEDGGADRGREWIAVSGSMGNLDSPIYEDPEGPDNLGQVAQAQRFAEFSMRLAMVSAQQQIMDLRSENAALRTENAQFMSRHLDVVSTFEQLVTARNRARMEEHESDTKKRRDRMAEDLFRVALDRLMGHFGLPPISGTIAAATLAPVPAGDPKTAEARADTAVDAAHASGAQDVEGAARWFVELHGLIESVTGEQLKAMAAIFGGEQRLAAIALYRAYVAGVVRPAQPTPEKEPA